MPGKRSWLWLIPFLLIAVWFGARGLDADPMWQDEYYMTRDVRTSNDPIALAVHIAAANPFHVPGYFIMENVWGRIFGGRPAIMRALALFIGVLTIAVTYRTGREFVSRRVGLYGAAVLASSAFFIYYWHELRMYTMTALTAALVLWLYLRLVTARREPTIPALIGFVVSIALALYIHYFLILYIAAVGVYHLMIAPKNARWWKITAAAVIGAVSLLPWVSVLMKSATRIANNGLEPSVPGGAALAEIAYVFSNGQTWLLVVLLLLGLLFLRSAQGRTRRGALALWVVVMAMLTIVLVANIFFRFLPPDRLRYIVLLFPAASLLVGMGLSSALTPASRSRCARLRPRKLGPLSPSPAGRGVKHFLKDILGTPWPMHWGSVEAPSAKPIASLSEMIEEQSSPQSDAYPNHASLSPRPSGEGESGPASLGSPKSKRSGDREEGVRAALLLWLLIGWWNNATMLTPNNIIGYVPFFPTHIITRDLRAVQVPGDYIVYVLPDSVPPDRAGADYRRSLSYNIPNEGLAADWEVVSKLDTSAQQTEQVSEVSAAIGDSRHYVWVAHPSDQAPTTLAPLQIGVERAGYGLCGPVEQRLGFRIDEYAPSPVCCTPSSVSRAPQATFSAVALMGVEARLDADQTALSVFVAFDGADKLPSDTYSVALHVVAEGSTKPVAQADFGLPSTSFLCDPHTVSLGALPGGTYRLRVIVYNWRTGERLSATVSGTRAPDDAVAAAAFKIAPK